MGSTYGELRLELEKEMERLTENIKGPKNIYATYIEVDYSALSQIDSNEIAVENFFNGYYYIARVYFRFDQSKAPDLPKVSAFWLYIPAKGK